jgi:hypothetical protein
MLPEKTSVDKFFYTLFGGHDWIVAGDRFETKPELMGNIVERSTSHGFPLYTINPIHPSIDFGWSFDPKKYEPNRPRRADLNCTSLKNLMFEIDGIPLDDQLELLFRSGIPWTAIVFSGNKSYHALLSLEDNLGQPHTKEGVEQYKQVWKRLAALINAEYAGKIVSLSEGVLDEATKNPSRFTRFPNYMRQGHRQRIEFMGKKCSMATLNKILEKCPLVKAPETNFVDVANFAKNDNQFWALCPKGLRNWIKYPEEWGNAEGNYPRLRNIAYWAKREVTKNPDLMISILDKHTFDYLNQIGYSREKIENVKRNIRRIFQESE